MNDVGMSSNRPYLVRALYEWIVDNGLTPHVLVDADFPNVSVPDSAVRQGKVVLNVGPTAVRELVMDNEQIGFSARFGGQPHVVYVPVQAVQAIYARENGQGMMFAPEPDGGGDDDRGPGDDASETNESSEDRRQHLRVVK